MSRSYFHVLTALALSFLFTGFAWAGEARPSAVSWESWTDLANFQWAQAARISQVEESAGAAVALQTPQPTVRPILECEPLPSSSQSPAASPSVFQAGSLEVLAPIPEASTLVLALLGTIGISLLRRRRS